MTANTHRPFFYDIEAAMEEAAYMAATTGITHYLHQEEHTIYVSRRRQAFGGRPMWSTGKRRG